ncbi:MAG: radical SAM protein [Candidatus Binatia bacterium]|nr:MAG: radical SAM protein [Candidatus Binatia bacterium]
MLQRNRLVSGQATNSVFPEAIVRFVLDPPPEPAYLRLVRSGELASRVRRAREELSCCRVCPRECRVDRLHATPPPHGLADSEQRGAERAVPSYIPKGTACFTGRWARVASAFAHFGEEDCLRGWNGSGTVFFSFCNLRCVFCQNWDVSQVGEGRELRAEELAAVLLDLQHQGCHNINFVTPEHVVPQVLEAVLLAAEAGLCIPLVYNTSAYDSLTSLALLDGVIDIYMPDFKYASADLAKRYLKASDYPLVARRVIREMHRQVGPLCFDSRGLACRGLLVRHLVMPGAREDAVEVLRFLAEEVSRDTYVNLMDQYHPAGAVLSGQYPELATRPVPSERNELEAIGRSFGLWRFDRRWQTRRFP